MVHAVHHSIYDTTKTIDGARQPRDSSKPNDRPTQRLIAFKVRTMTWLSR